MLPPTSLPSNRRLLAMLLVACCWYVPARAAMPGFDAQANLVYATVGGRDLHLDLLTPRGLSEPAPCVLWVHGGGWVVGDKSWNRLRWLAEKGYAIAAINYRLSGAAVFPAQIHDCKGAVRWLRANGERLGLRTDRIAAAGSSAGGHLVALLGTTGDVAELEGSVGGNLDRSSRVQAVIDFYGPTDLSAIGDYGPAGIVAFHNSQQSPVYQLLGGPLNERQQHARLASPTHYVSADDAPLLIFHGKRDPIVPFQQSELLAEAYRRRSLNVTLHLLPDSGHGWQKKPDEEARVLGFLKTWIRDTPPASQ